MSFSIGDDGVSIELALSYIVAIFIFAVVPGPGVFAVMARAMVYGWRNCISLIVGIVLSDVVYLLFACYGLAFVAEHFNSLFTLIRFAGAVFLGWSMWTKPITHSMERMDADYTDEHLSGLIQGFLISASNPKVMLFYLAFVPGFMDLSELLLASVILQALLTAVGIFLGTFMIAVFASRLSLYFKSERSLSYLNKTAGGTMMGVGAYIAYDR